MYSFCFFYQMYQEKESQVHKVSSVEAWQITTYREIYNLQI